MVHQFSNLNHFQDVKSTSFGLANLGPNRAEPRAPKQKSCFGKIEEISVLTQGVFSLKRLANVAMFSVSIIDQ